MLVDNSGDFLDGLALTMEQAGENSGLFENFRLHAHLDPPDPPVSPVVTFQVQPGDEFHYVLALPLYFQDQNSVPAFP